MKTRLVALIILTLFLLLIIWGCKSEDLFKKLYQEENLFDRFEDSYQEYVYKNESLGLVIEYNSDWVILTDYVHFDDFQKKYAQYFVSNYGEVLFIGYNDQEQIGVRATCESVNLSNDEYFKNIKNSLSADLALYQIKIMEEKEVVFKNVKGIRVFAEVKLNENNYFKFDSLVFRNNKYNFKLDFWMEAEKYEELTEDLELIYNTIDFTGMKIDDQTNDASKEEIK